MQALFRSGSADVSSALAAWMDASQGGGKFVSGLTIRHKCGDFGSADKDLKAKNMESIEEKDPQNWTPISSIYQYNETIEVRLTTNAKRTVCRFQFPGDE